MYRPNSPVCIRLLASCVCALFAATPVQPAAAGGTQTFHVESYDDFDSGEVEGAAIEGSGRVTVGLQPTRAELEPSTVYTCAPGAKGEVLIGTADKAGLYRVKPGKPGKQPTVQKLADLPGVVVSTLTRLPNGDIVAATLPGGTIHRISPKGKVSEFAKLDVKQIWQLQVHKGRLLVATGPKGELYSLDLNGKNAKMLLDVPEKNLLSVLAVGGEIVAGTSPQAKLYQVIPDNTDGVLLHDFSGDEVRSLAVTGNGLLAVVNKFSSRGLSSLDALTKTLNRTSLIGQNAEGKAGHKSEDIKASGRLYHVSMGTRLDPSRAGEATWDIWLGKSKQYFTSVVAGDMAGTAYVSSSYDGKVYRVRGRRDRATVSNFDERQTTSLCALPDKSLIATTGDGAAVYHLSNKTKPKASIYRSEVFDAEQPATYGQLMVRGQGKFSVRARVGPGDEPDKRWSEWKPVHLKKRQDGQWGSLGVGKRRFLQLEVSLQSPEAEVREFKVYYAPENLPPMVKTVTVETPDFERSDNDEPDPEVTIKWSSDARDDDDLIYSVKIRPEGSSDQQWIDLGKADKLLTKTKLSLELDSVPDGTYEVEVTASDEPSNGSGRAQTDKLVSAPFTIDRARPTVAKLSQNGTAIKGQANDTGSYIHDVAYSVDGGPFRAASAVDGVFDSPSEEFVLELPKGLTPGKHRVVVRARDAFGNLASTPLVVDLKRS